LKVKRFVDVEAVVYGAMEQLLEIPKTGLKRCFQHC